MYYGEKFNALTHLVGAVLALAGTVVLIVVAALGGGPWKVVSVSVYGLTLVLLYSFSVLYHSLQGRAKNVLRELDHQSIYLLIAGSYTPFCLFYTIGIVFYALDSRLKHGHGVWHLFVIAGSVTHYVAILRYVVLAA
jgi:hemolysin III